MQVYSYVGKRATAVRALVSQDESILRPIAHAVSESRSAALENRALGAINGYSPSRRPKPFIQEIRPQSASRRAEKPRKSSERVARESSASRFLQAAFSLGILAIVPYFVFGFLDKQMDMRDLVPLSSLSSVNNSFGFGTTSDDFSSLEAIISEAADSELTRLAYSLHQTDTTFDENGNLVLSDGTVVNSEESVFGEPIEWTSYTIQKGETIDKITYKFGLGNISTLIAANDIANVRTIQAGQKIRIPSQDGIPHKVASGESLNSISVKYHVSVEEILDVNDLSSESLVLGQELFIPGAKMDKTALRNAMGETFACPLPKDWRLTSHFGNRIDPISGVRRSHTGIDMALPKGTPIKAAMGGKVITATFSPIFGYYVVIDHGNGYQSLYGHMTKFVVKAGQYVSQGQKIGNLGSTGYSTGPHLHFTVYKNGKLVDPLPLIK